MPETALALLNRPSLDAARHTDGAPAFTFVDPLSPQLSVLDLGATRGDGIFEGISVGNGYAQALEHHLRRFAKSAAALDLPAPDLDAWRAVISAVIAALDPSEEAWVKIVMTRGIEGGTQPTGWAFGSTDVHYEQVRVDGVSVVTLDRGYRHDVEQTSPWLLAGAKTLSYAVNRSVMREAAKRGVDDVIFVSSDGFVLEGPSSTVLYRRGNSLFTPGTGLGILDGTTQANLFRYAQRLGMTTGYELITPAELALSDSVWLVSSVRLLVPVRALDGVARDHDIEFTADANAWLKQLRE